jgi:hypothetical protein
MGRKIAAAISEKLSAAQRAWKKLGLAGTLVALSLGLSPTMASDHADPVPLQDPESNITGLFFFPRGDQMVLVLNVRRSLLNPKPFSLNPLKPFNLEPFTYQINIDYTTPIGFGNKADLARYGGTVQKPEEISANATITLRLSDEAKLKDVVYWHLQDTDKIQTFVGVRDDPFIFPRFFKKNVISMVVILPRTALPADKQHFILWATSAKNGKMADHVGRSIRSQLPRFGFLNDLEPRDHVRALVEQKASRERIYNFLTSQREWWPRAIAELIQPTFLIRPYDLQPDVMIYNELRPAGFPNGRLLSDDVVAQVCATGDCLLQDLSFIEAKDPPWPRTAVNDKPLLDTLPFLAEPWEDGEEAAAPTDSIWPYIVAVLLVVVLLSWVAVEIVRRTVLFLFRRLWPRSVAAA